MSGRFEHFSKVGADLAGRDSTKKIVDFLLATKPGDRISPRAASLSLGLDAEDVEDLFELGATADVRLLADASQVRCPHESCAVRIDRLPLLAELEAEGEASCPDCHKRIDEVRQLRIDRRYTLSDEAQVEATAWQAKQAERPKYRAVALCAIPDELAQLRKQMALHDSVVAKPAADRAVYLCGTLAGDWVDWEIWAATTTQTNYQASSGAVAAIQTFNPEVIIYLGIAGSLDSHVALGDVVVADRVHDYEVGKEQPSKDGAHGDFQERHLQHQSSFQLLQWAGVVALDGRWRTRIEQHAEGLITEPNVHIEPIAAGSKVVASRDSHTFELIGQAAPRAVAVEMEGAGFLAAIHRFEGVDGLLVRGISDCVDGKSNSDDEGWRHQAAANAAAFVFELLTRYEPAPTMAAAIDHRS